jgi:hypothetical protein
MSTGTGLNCGNGSGEHRAAVSEAGTGGPATLRLRPMPADHWTWSHTPDPTDPRPMEAVRYSLVYYAPGLTAVAEAEARTADWPYHRLPDGGLVVARVYEVRGRAH